MQVDPVLSLLIGALGAALLGLLGAWIQSRREHARWIREQRLDAYAEFLRITERHPSFHVEEDQFDKFLEQQQDAYMRVMLVGSEPVIDAASTHDDALSHMIDIRDRLVEEKLAAGLSDDDLDPDAEPEGNPAELQAAIDKQHDTRERFLRAARKELGIKK